MADRIVWNAEREARIRRALSVVARSPSPTFTRDDMRAALDEIDRLRAAFPTLPSATGETK